jgi:hypothetical protein
MKVLSKLPWDRMRTLRSSNGRITCCNAGSTSVQVLCPSLIDVCRFIVEHCVEGWSKVMSARHSTMKPVSGERRSIRRIHEGELVLAYGSRCTV